jgi:hypothetical protein
MIIHCFFLLFLLTNLGLVRPEVEFVYDQPMFLNASTLSISSITYNPNSVQSLWIQRLFGSDAIFYNRTVDTLKSPKSVRKEEKLERVLNFQRHYKLPPEFVLPSCSIEMLGYAHVTGEAPFSFEAAKQAPTIGKAQLTFSLDDGNDENGVKSNRTSKGTETWNCVYRGMEDNLGLFDKIRIRPRSYWPVFLYCPAPNYEDSCLNLLNIYRVKLKRLLARELQVLYKVREEDILKTMKNNKMGVERSLRGQTADEQIGNEPETSQTLAERKAFMLYKRSLRMVSAITNTHLLGVRSFYMLPGFAISKNFVLDVFRNVLNIPKGATFAKSLKQKTFKAGTSDYFVNRPFNSFTNHQDPDETAREQGKFVIPNILHSAKLSVRLEKSVWEVPVEIDLINNARKTRSEQLAVCSIIPYVSSDDVKAEINGAMIYDYIRYYTKLGYKIMLFDRNGRHYDSIFHSSYAARTSKEFGSFENVLYYNYTMLQLLQGYQEEIKYENDQSKVLGAAHAVVTTDYDKRYTYTHCRFAFKHLYGIENVLINDFDEFLYCPRGTTDLQKQKQFQKSYFTHMRLNGVEQLFMKQRVIVSKEPDLKKCLQRQVDLTKDPLQLQSNPNASIFECITAQKFEVKALFDKVLHFAHACPYTHYHFSSNLRHVDCFANSYLSATQKMRVYSNNGCSLIHLTTRPAAYNRTHTNKPKDYMSSVSEIHTLLNS